MRITAYLLSFLFIITLLNCNTNDGKPSTEYIQSYTDGVISRKASIKVILQKNLADSIGELNPQTFKIVPNVKGELSWRGKNTIVFQPYEPLQPDKKYKYVIEPRYLGLEGYKVLEKEVSIKPIYTAINLVDIIYHDDYVDLYFNITSSDYIPAMEIENAVDIVNEINYKSLSWQHNDAGTAHKLNIKGVETAKEKQEFKIIILPDIFSGEQKAEYTLAIPSKGLFEIVEMNVYNGEDQYTELFFTDELDEHQNLNGIVSIIGYDGDLNIDIQGNRLRLFPDKRLSGSYQLRISSGLKNTEGKILDPRSKTLKFKSFAPEIKVKNENVILPEGDKLYFPFKAVGLNAVDMEIIQIKEGNVLQFLQENSLSGDDYIYEVGKPIISKKIELSSLESANIAHKWSQYALDLNSYIDVKPGAIYSVRLTFRPEYTTIPCASSLTEREINYEYYPYSSHKSIYENSSYYGIYGRYENYSYKDRNDPCTYAYYNRKNFVNKNVIASDLSIIAKKSRAGELIVSVNDIQSADPRKNVNVSLYDYQQNKLSNKTTSAGGVVRFDLKDDEKGYFITAKKGDNVMYLNLASGEALSLSEFEVGGVNIKDGSKAFLYADRGVWRPGENIHLTMMVQELNDLPSIPARLEVYDPKGRKYTTVNGIRGTDGIYTTTINTSTSALTGTYKAVFHYGGAQYVKYLLVKTVRPNRLKIVLKEVQDLNNNLFTGKISSEWLHGASAGNLEYRLNMHAATTSFDDEKLKDYSFDNYYAPESEEQFKTVKEKLDKNGEGLFTVDPQQLKKLQSPVSLFLESRVYEPSGNFSSRNKKFTIYPYAHYAGVKIPTTRYGGSGFITSDEAVLEMISVDKNGNPEVDAEIEVKLYKANSWWWWQSHNDGSTVKQTKSRELIREETIKTATDGECSIRIPASVTGYFIVEVKNLSSGHTAAMRFYKYRNYYDIAESGGKTAMLPLVYESKTIQKGEDIKFALEAPKDARLLVSLEDGNNIQFHKWYDLQEGKNNISVPVENYRGGGIYVSTLLVRKRATLNDDLPLRRYNVQYVEIQDEDRILKPEIALPSETEPNSTLEVTVSEKTGKKMHYTIMAVDEGLLDLTNFTTPDPHRIFSAKEALDVQTWDLYDNIVGPYTGEEKLLSMGGDASLKYREQAEVNRFEPVSIFKGPFTLKANSEVTHTFHIPQYIGSVKVMVVAKSGNAFGSTDGTVKVKKELMVLPTLPRVLGPNEEFQLPITIFADKEQISTVHLSVKELNGYATFPQGNEKSIQYKSHRSTYSLPVKMKPLTGVGKFVITGKSGSFIARDTVNINIRNPRPIETTSQLKSLASGENTELNFKTNKSYSEEQYVLGFTPLIPLNKAELQEKLLNYPFSCGEQITSRYIAMLLADKQQYEAQLENYPLLIKKYQTENGGYSFWPSSDYPNPWISSYIGHMFYLLKKDAFNVPADQINRWVEYQKQAARSWNPNLRKVGHSVTSNDVDQAYRLYVLSLHSRAFFSEMNRLREYDQLSVEAADILASAYANVGRDDVARAILDERNSYETYSRNGGMYSEIRNNAIEAYALTQSGLNDYTTSVIDALGINLKNETWMNTQESAFLLLLMRELKIGNSSAMEITYSINNGKERTINSADNRNNVDITDEVLNNNSTVSVSNTGDKKIFVYLLSQYRKTQGSVDSESEGLDIKTKFYSVNMNRISVDQLAQGRDFYAVTTVSIDNNRYSRFDNVTLTQVFPSGWEIIEAGNFPQVFKTENVSTSVDYRDIRDDRVNTFFNLNDDEKFVEIVRLTTTYVGEFHKPGVRSEVMYRPEIYAQTAGREVQVKGK